MGVAFVQAAARDLHTKAGEGGGVPLSLVVPVGALPLRVRVHVLLDADAVADVPRRGAQLPVRDRQRLRLLENLRDTAVYTPFDALIG
eukprot:1178169-Prorocentrum_minimum.AAC.2